MKRAFLSEKTPRTRQSRLTSEPRDQAGVNPPIRCKSGRGEVEPVFNPLDAVALAVKARLHDGEIAMHVGDAFLHKCKAFVDGCQAYANFAHVLLDIGDVAANCAQMLDNQVLDVLDHKSISWQGSLAQRRLRMKRAFLLCIMLAAAPLPAFAQETAGAPLSGKLLITGSSTMAPMVEELGKRFRARHPGVVITVRS